MITYTKGIRTRVKWAVWIIIAVIGLMFAISWFLFDFIIFSVKTYSSGEIIRIRTLLITLVVFSNLIGIATALPFLTSIDLSIDGMGPLQIRMLHKFLEETINKEDK